MKRSRIEDKILSSIFGDDDEWVTIEKFKPSKPGLKRIKNGTSINLCICDVKWVGSRNVPMNARFKINKECPIHGK